MQSQNGWPLIRTVSRLRHWRIPGTRVILPLEPGPGGFLLAHLAAWFDRDIERIDDVADDWGWAYRRVVGSSSWSNHASGTAVDLNATRHPLGARGTFPLAKRAVIIARLADGPYSNVRWGGTYQGRADEMHFELIGSRQQVTRAAGKLLCTPLGRAVRRANPSVPRW